MGFRDYSPNLNRFLTRDNYNGALADLNLGLEPWTSNRYAFAAGNPINLIELDGHDPYGCSTKDDAANSKCVRDNNRSARIAAGMSPEPDGKTYPTQSSNPGLVVPPLAPPELSSRRQASILVVEWQVVDWAA